MKQRLKDSVGRKYCENTGQEFRNVNMPQDVKDAINSYIENLFARNQYKIKYYIDS
ncbi:MAG: hypothetical protein IJF02_02595 [Oscillospiraceae bacterium]|nr:hypothetical protein [Oscillospiraceae bacterium]